MLRARPSPRAPGTRSRTGLFVSRFLIALLIAFPSGFVSSILYEPALKLSNGLVGGTRTVEYAIVGRDGSGWVLDSPYWGHGFRWTVMETAAMPPDLTAGSVAKVTLRRGLLGAQWIESVEYTVLK